MLLLLRFGFDILSILGFLGGLLLVDRGELLFEICELDQVVIHLVAESFFEASFVVVELVHHLDFDVLVLLTRPPHKAGVVAVAQPRRRNSSAERLDRVFRLLKRDEAAVLLDLLLAGGAPLRVHLASLHVATAGQVLHQVLGRLRDQVLPRLGADLGSQLAVGTGVVDDHGLLQERLHAPARLLRLDVADRGQLVLHDVVEAVLRNAGLPLLRQLAVLLFELVQILLLQLLVLLQVFFPGGFVAFLELHDELL